MAWNTAFRGIVREVRPVLILRLGELRLELDGETLCFDGRSVRLGATAARLLAYLAENRERVVSTEELLREVWDGVRVTPASVQRAVHAVRGVLADASLRKVLIRTVRGHGYQLAAAVEAVDDRPLGDELPFVDRSSELGRLSDAIERAREGRGRLVLVGGPPGIGKTRLLHELEALAGRRGFTFLCGHCPEESGGAALWPFEEILRGAADRDPGAFEALGASDRAAIRSAFPALEAGDAAPVALDPGAARYRLYEAVRRALVACARDRALVVAIDDLHRADETSLRLLEWIAARIAGERIALVAAYRDLSVRRDPVLGACIGRLLRLPGATAERLSSLARADVEDTARRFLRGPLDPRESEALWSRSGGNPFFLATLLHQIRLGRGAAAGAEGAHPPEAHEAVRQHVELLGSDTRKLMRAAAVLGREFDADLLQALAGARAEDVTRALAEARAAGLVEGTANGARFVHALVVECLHDALDQNTRTSLHARAIGILEGRAPGDASAHGVLAEHAWLAAPSIGAAAAAAYCERAAQSALRRCAFEEAARQHERALRLSQGADPQRRLALWLAVGESRALAGQVAAATDALRRAIDLAGALGDGERHARAALALALMRGDETEAIDAEWIATLEAALEAHREETPLRARLLSRLAAASWSLPPRERARELVGASVALARRSGDPDALAEVMARAYRILQTGPGDDAERRATSLELAAAIARARDPIVALGARLHLLWEALLVGDRRAFDEQVARVVQQADAVGAPHADWCALVARTSRAHLTGQLARAEDLAARGLALGEGIGLRVARQNHVLQLLSIRWDQGRLGELVPLLAPVAESPFHPLAWGVATSLARLFAGSPGPARELLRELCLDPGRLPLDCNYTITLYMLAELAVELRDLDAAEVLVPRIVLCRGRHALVALGFCHWGAVERPLGRLCALLERWEEAEAAFEEALARDRRLGALAGVARGQRDLGRCLLQRGRAPDRERARRLLGEGASLAGDLGMGEVARACDEALPAVSCGA